MTDKKTWEVTIPIAGHALLTVQADTEEEAIQKGIMEAALLHVEEWEALERFHEGNVAYVPRPWSAEAVCVDDDEDVDE
jgi:hypothetical protein